jgi:hypothetical protein
MMKSFHHWKKTPSNSWLIKIKTRFMERLLSIPKSIDNPNLILKNFEKVLVGSIENESAEVRAESSSIISSPKIIAVSSTLEGTRFSSIQQTNLPGMKTNSKPHQKKRSLTRKTAIITPFPTSPISLWYICLIYVVVLTCARNIRNEVTYPKNSSVQVSEVSAPTSPRKKIRKVCFIRFLIYGRREYCHQLHLPSTLDPTKMLPC